MDDVRSLLAVPRNIIITSHRNPDGDAIGSSLAMYHWLTGHGHRVMVALPSEYPKSYAWMPAAEAIQIFDIDPEPIAAFASHADISIMLDYNSLDRIDKLGALLTQKAMYSILIDHHLYPEPLGDFTLIDSDASSTCELVYRFIEMHDKKPVSDLTVATCLYTGILTDTGSFQYGTSPALYRLVADLQELGLDLRSIHDQVFNTLDEKTLRLLGHCLLNRMEIWPEFHTGVIFLNKHDFQVYDIQRGDTEGIVNYLLRLQDVQMAVFVRQQPSIIKISFRSKGDFSVEELAKNHFHGGGHRNAAGGYSKDSLAATMDKLRSVMPLYVPKMLKSANHES